MNYTYVFNHIPKCAGTTVRFAFKEWFNVEMDYQKGWSQDNYSQFVACPLDLDRLPPNTLVSGHYCINDSFLRQRYPQVYDDSRFRLITFVRDPLKQIISLYKFREREGQNNPEDSLVKYLFHQKNFISRILECDESNYQEIINKYYFVGVQEHLQESVDLLASKLKKNKIDLAKYSNNIAPKSQQILPLNAETIYKFKENNSLDYKIVDYCNKLFQQMR